MAPPAATIPTDRLQAILEDICSFITQAKARLGAIYPNEYDQLFSADPSLSPPAKRQKKTNFLAAPPISKLDICQYCKKEFDVSKDKVESSCHWHEGQKVAYGGSATIWEENGIEDPDEYRNNPAYAEHFMWGRCEKPLDSKGCVTTKHKGSSPASSAKRQQDRRTSSRQHSSIISERDTSSDNGFKEVSHRTGHVSGFDSTYGLSAGKEKARSEIRERVSRPEICKNCNKAFDFNEDDGEEACVWHPGRKVVHADFWESFDCEIRGRSPENFTDEAEFAGGFRWTCCEGEGDFPGCEVTKHSAKPAGSAVQFPNSQDGLGSGEEDEQSSAILSDPVSGLGPNKPSNKGFDQQNPITLDD